MPACPARRVTAVGGLQERGLPLVLVEQIALQEQPARAVEHLGRDILRPQLGRDAQIGVHRPLSVGRDEDDRARTGKPRPRHRRVHKARARGLGLAGIKPPDLVIGDTADEGRAQAQPADARQRVRHAAARDHARLVAARRMVVGLGGHQVFRPLSVDQLHDALGDAQGLQPRFLGRRDDVHHGIADADDIGPSPVRGGHAVFSS